MKKLLLISIIGILLIGIVAAAAYIVLVHNDLPSNLKIAYCNPITYKCISDVSRAIREFIAKLAGTSTDPYQAAIQDLKSKVVKGGEEAHFRSIGWTRIFVTSNREVLPFYEQLRLQLEYPEVVKG